MKLPSLGSWVQTVAVGVLVTALTHRARWTGLRLSPSIAVEPAVALVAAPAEVA